MIIRIIIIILCHVVDVWPSTPAGVYIVFVWPSDLLTFWFVRYLFRVSSSPPSLLFLPSPCEYNLSAVTFDPCSAAARQDTPTTCHQPSYSMLSYRCATYYLILYVWNITKEQNFRYRNDKCVSSMQPMRYTPIVKQFPCDDLWITFSYKWPTVCMPFDHVNNIHWWLACRVFFDWSIDWVLTVAAGEL